MAGSMNLTLPVNGASSGTWGTLLNAALALIEEHTHAPGSGARVPANGLRINADVAWADAGTSYAITAAKALDFTPSAAAGMSGYAGALFVNSADNELYYRTTGGTNVKLTSGTTLNVSIVGGIGGDYASSGALLAYVDADDRYTLQQQGSPKPWAGAAIGNLDIYEQAASIVNRVRIKSPAALAASYDLTLLAALPGTTQLLQVSSAGVLTASNAMASGEHVTVSAAGRFKHGDMEIVADSTMGHAVTGTFTVSASVISVGAAGGEWSFLLPPLPVGARIKSVTFNGNHTSSTTSTCRLINIVMASASGGTIASQSTGAVNGTWATTIAAINHVLVNTNVYRLNITVGSTTSGATLRGALVTFDFP